MHYQTLVLISTYWNVNFDYDVQITQIQHVLISTYWNVNTVFEFTPPSATASFNLNLLECK